MKRLSQNMMKIQSVFCVVILCLTIFSGKTTTFADETAMESKLTAFLNAFTENAAAPADWFGLFTIDNVQNNRFFWNGNSAAQTSYKELIETFKENNTDVSSSDKVKSALFEIARKKTSAITDSSQITMAEKDLLAISRFDDVTKLTGEPKKHFEHSLKIFQDIKQNAETDLTKGTAQKYDRYETVGGIVLRAKDDGSVFVVPTHLENLASVGGSNKTKNVVHIANAQNIETAKEIYKTLVNAENGLDKDGTEFNTTIAVNGELVNVVLPLADQLKDDLNSLENISPPWRKEINTQIDKIQSVLKTGYKTIFVNAYSQEFVTAVEPLVKLVQENKLTVKESAAGKHQFAVHLADGSEVVLNETEIFKNKLDVLEQVADVLKSAKTLNCIDKAICEKVENAIGTVPANSADYLEQLQKVGIGAEQIQNGVVTYYYLHEGQKFNINVPTDKQANLNKVGKYMVSGLSVDMFNRAMAVSPEYVKLGKAGNNGAWVLVHAQLFNDPDSKECPIRSKEFRKIVAALKNYGPIVNGTVRSGWKNEANNVTKWIFFVPNRVEKQNDGQYKLVKYDIFSLLAKEGVKLSKSDRDILNKAQPNLPKLKNDNYEAYEVIDNKYKGISVDFSR